MRNGILASTTAVLLLAAGACADSAQEAPETAEEAQEAAQETGMVRVVISTDFGDIEVDIDTENAPGTSANFLRYVDAGHYNGGQFHRTVTMDNQPNDSVRIEVIQADVNEEEFGEQGFDAIPMERTSVTGLRHVDGAISMARGAPDSATSSFFFCINDQPSLDFGGNRNPDGQGFAAFGQVVSGMDVVRMIQGQPVDAQQLDPPVRITSVRRAD
jgi:peptidyl-prolyl cis-trans isomerase A (cyclophilin A)